MILNYVKLAFRNLLKSPGYSALNLAGLSLGTACCLYMLLYVRDHQGFDTQHAGYDRIYRIASNLSGAGPEPLKTACVSPPIAPTLAADFGEVEQWTRVVNPPETSHHLLRNGNRSFFETRGLYVDSTFFDLFQYHFTAGSAEKCLDEPYTVVLTQPVAEKLFGTAQSAVGQNMEIDNRFGKNTFRVTGVIDEAAGKTHINGHFFMAMNSGGMGEYIRQNRNFGAQNFIYGYLKLLPNADAGAFSAKFPGFLEKYGGDEMRSMGMKKELVLEPLADIHTRSERSNQLGPTVSSSFLKLLLLLAAFVQGIACINFMNLATARASRRAREVGIRKAIGAGRRALIGQFLGESTLLTAMAIAAALPLVMLSLPWLNRLTGAEVQLSLSRDGGLWLMLGALVAVTGLVAGSYPAFYLSAFQPVKVLKGASAGAGNRSAATLRRGLVTSQFVIAIALLVGALIARRQFEYMAHTRLGFEKTQKIAVPFRTEQSRQVLEQFKRELSELPEIESTGATVAKLGDPALRDLGMYKEGGSSDKATLVHMGVCDEDYLATMKIPLMYGRNFTPADTSNQIIVNQKALRDIGVDPASATGQRLFWTFQGETIAFEVVGVVQDFNFQSLYQSIKPYAFTYSPPAYNQYAVVSTRTADFSTILPKIEAAWHKLLPGQPFEYTFLEEALDKQYASDRTLANIISAFTLIALLISCLGLFGLAAFAAEQRTKEIGIRKVLGASVASVSNLLIRDFVKLILIAMVIAAPIAWYFMSRWLTDFAYRADIPWWIFAAGGAIAVIIAFVTVGFQSLRAALANPVQSLRSE